tara:strand:+ start:187 stop:486 length:300 start_codon:yes stop_codon:yes gene_type:complete
MISEYRIYPQTKQTTAEIIENTVIAGAEVYEKQFFVLNPGDTSLNLLSEPKANSEIVSLNGVTLHSNQPNPDYSISGMNLNINFEIENEDLLQVTYVQG